MEKINSELNMAYEQIPENRLIQRYNALSSEQKVRFSAIQKRMARLLITDYPIEDIPVEQQSVIRKLREAYSNFKKTAPDEPFPLIFDHQSDRQTYINLIREMSLNKLENQHYDLNEMVMGENAINKVVEYDQRIRAIKSGKPLKTSDKLDELLNDFENFTQQVWYEGFSINEFKQDNELRKRVSAVTPIDIQRVVRQDNIQRNSRKPENINFTQADNHVRVSYSGQDWYSINGKYFEKNIHGRNLRVIVLNKSNIYAAYEPFTDTYTIGHQAHEDLLKNPALFLYDIEHEAAHDRYFSLNQEQQSKINDLFLNDKGLKTIIQKFATTLYTDQFKFQGQTAGENYLNTHDMNNDSLRQNLIVKENARGIKDVRSIIFNLRGEHKEVCLNLLITELISYMAALELGKDIFNKASEKGRAARNGIDPRYDIAKMCFDYIQNNSKISQVYNSFNLYSNNNAEFKEIFDNMLKNQNN